MVVGVGVHCLLLSEGGQMWLLCCVLFCCWLSVWHNDSEVDFELDVERDDEKMQIPALTCVGIQGKDQTGVIICQVVSRLARLQGC